MCITRFPLFPWICLLRCFCAFAWQELDGAAWVREVCDAVRGVLPLRQPRGPRKLRQRRAGVQVSRGCQLT